MCRFITPRYDLDYGYYNTHIHDSVCAKFLEKGRDKCIRRTVELNV